MKKTAPEELMPGLFRFEDTCNVYVLCGDKSSIAIDFGSGQWLAAFKALDRPPLEQVFLTHHHADQCAGLAGRKKWPFTIHAPVGAQAFLEPEKAKAYAVVRPGAGCPPSYSVDPRGIANVQYDLAGFTDRWWGRQRLRFLHTPGHGPGAVSMVADHGGKQVVFCGDAAHAGATVWQPYHLEWDHWTGSGVLAAWEGVQCLSNIGVDLLCPGHGPVVAGGARAELRSLASRLMRLYEAKGSICPGEKDRYFAPDFLDCGARELLPDLYQYGGNGYLLLSVSGEAMAIDPTLGDMNALDDLLADLGRPEVTCAAASHYHCDHVDALPVLQQKFGTRACLHPRVAEPLWDPAKFFGPWLVREAIVADEVWPEEGTWSWHEFDFRVAPWPGQTWWHCAFMAVVSGRKVFFGGDSFQPNSRWNGTGGFCSFNGSRFSGGYIPSARRIIEWDPDLLACGHGTYYDYRRQHFEKIIRWAEKAEATVRALCPDGDLEQHYYLHDLPE